MVDYKITGCAPKKINITAMPFVGAMIYGNFGGGNPYTGHLSRCLGQNISMQQAGEQAFRNMIADYLDTGKVNEHIYRETIKRPPVPG